MPLNELTAGTEVMSWGGVSTWAKVMSEGAAHRKVEGFPCSRVDVRGGDTEGAEHAASLLLTEREGRGRGGGGVGDLSWRIIAGGRGGL